MEYNDGHQKSLRQARNNIVLTPLGRQHLVRTREWANDPELRRLMDRGAPVGEDEHERWFSSLGDRSDCAYFAIEMEIDVEAAAGTESVEHDRRHVGNVWLWAIDDRHRRAEVRIVVGDPKARGLGVGVSALELLVDHAFEALALHKLYAYVLSFNARALRAFERAGFVVEGILRADRWSEQEYVDVFLLARINGAPGIPHRR